MYRTCKCGGIIREMNKPYWDTLPSCSCQSPTMIQTPIIITDKTTAVNCFRCNDNGCPACDVKSRGSKYNPEPY